MSDFTDNFSKGFARFMARNELQLKDVADWFKVSQATISKWRSGKTKPYLDSICLLIEKGMRLEEIFGSELAQALSLDYQKRQAVENPGGQLTAAKSLLAYIQTVLDERTV